MQERETVIQKISETLTALEARGDLFITTANPRQIAGAIFHATLESWFEEFVGGDEPIETTITHLLEQTSYEVEAKFNVPLTRAKEIVNSYYNEWLKLRSMKEIAEIYWHETPREMANRAYYYIELGRPDNRDLDYLDWRKASS